MVIQDFASKVVFLDTAPLIYFIEGQLLYQPVLKRLFDFNDTGGFLFATSTVTLLEVLVKPLRDGQTALPAQYRTILTTSPSIELFEITPLLLPMPQPD